MSEELKPHTMEEDFKHFLVYSGLFATSEGTKALLHQAFEAAWEPTIQVLYIQLAEARGLIRRLEALSHEDGGRSFPTVNDILDARAWLKKVTK